MATRDAVYVQDQVVLRVPTDAQPAGFWNRQHALARHLRATPETRVSLRSGSARCLKAADERADNSLVGS